jgi:hypothetical protein
MEKEEIKGLSWKAPLSILTGVAWLIFLLVWLFFYAGDYSLYQNFAIFLLSIVVLIIILGVPWAYWAISTMSKKEKEMWRIKGFKLRVGVSIIIAFVFLFFLIYLFWYLAGGYDFFQNLAIFIITILITGGIMGAFWARWGIKNADRFD